MRTLKAAPTDWSTMDSLIAGTLLGRRYRLIDRIGVGGMSVIWRARDEMLDRLVAIKALAASLSTDARFRESVRTEARAAAAIDHPNATAVYDYGEAVDAGGGITPYVVMELLDGEPLSSRLTGGPLPWPTAVEICAAVGDALAAAHRHGVVHRDITPDNVMLTDVGVKVLDFGIATAVGAPDEDDDGATFGTPAYVAPERLHGRPARPETDTYGLGVVLYETLTGHRPFPIETWEELAGLPRRDPPLPAGVPGLPAAVGQLCRRCLATDPRRRPTASRVAQQLRRHLPATAPRRRWRAAAAVAAALALGVLLGATALSQQPRPQAYPPAVTGATPSLADDRVRTPSPAPPTPRPSPPPTAGTDDAHAEAGPSFDATLTVVYQLIDDGQANDEIREDVALDLRQLVDHLRASLHRGTADLPAETSALRDKVFTRATEGSLSWETAEALDSALAELASA